MTATEKRSLSDRAVELGLEATVVREILATTATMLDAVHLLGLELERQESLTGRLLRGQQVYAEELFGLEPRD